MTSRPCPRRTPASWSASVVLPAAGGPSTATRSGCAVVRDSIASASRPRSALRVPLCTELEALRVDVDDGLEAGAAHRRGGRRKQTGGGGGNPARFGGLRDQLCSMTAAEAEE